MKKFTPIVFLLSTFAVSYAVELPTVIVGGGSEFMEIDDAVDPGVITVTTGTWDQYAGVEGGSITYNFSQSGTYESIKSFTVSSDFEIKSVFTINFDKPNGYDNRNQFEMTVSKGATLTLDNLNVVPDPTMTSDFSSNYICIYGGGTKIIDTSNYGTINALLQLTGGVFTNKGDLNLGYLKTADAANNPSTISMGGNLTVRGYYCNYGGGITNFNLNGYDFNLTDVVNFESDSAKTINITFGNDANGDGMVVYAINSFNEGQSTFSSATFVFKDYDPLTDLVLVKTALSDPDSFFVFEGYEGTSVSSKVLTEEDTIDLQIDSSYAGYTSYYVIPEPAALSAMFAFAALAMVFLRRKK